MAILKLAKKGGLICGVQAADSVFTYLWIRHTYSDGFQRIGRSLRVFRLAIPLYAADAGKTAGAYGARDGDRPRYACFFTSPAWPTLVFEGIDHER